jgi:hypothetical protein
MSTTSLLENLVSLAWPMKQRFWNKHFAEELLREYHLACGHLCKSDMVGPLLFNAVCSPRDLALVSLFQVYCAFISKGVDKWEGNWKVDPERVVYKIHNVWLNTPEGQHTMDRVMGRDGEVTLWPRPDIFMIAGYMHGFSVVDARPPISNRNDYPGDRLVINMEPTSLSLKLHCHPSSILQSGTRK